MKQSNAPDLLQKNTVKNTVKKLRLPQVSKRAEQNYLNLFNILKENSL